MASDVPDPAAERAGLDALLAIRPLWTALVPARERIALDGRWLLHAGPPLADACNPPPPILSSAVLACMYEGWARTEHDAETLVRQGAIRLVSAQQQRCVTPLAALVSPASSVIVIEDQAQRVAPVHALLGAVGGTDLRFGTRDASILDRLAARDGAIAATLRVALAEPIALLPIAKHALQQGDDLHNRTTAATQALAACLAERYACRERGAHIAVDELLRGLAATPLFFLTFWMAAAKLMLSAAEHAAPRTLVTRMAGNGEAFGVSLAGNPEAWITVPAAPPRGPYLAEALQGRAALGAIGDSAVIDALGCGGQALHLAPEPRAALNDHLPAAAGLTASTLLMASHPALAIEGLRVGLDAKQVVASGMAPLVTLGMVDAKGEKGLLGRGVYSPPIDLFVAAIAAATRGRVS